MTLTHPNLSVAGQRRLQQPHHVYELWSADGRCLYVGCTSNLRKRIRKHRTTKREGLGWWPEVARIESTVYPGYAGGRCAEAARIRELSPVYNVQLQATDALGLAQAAEYAECHQDTVRRACEAGELHGIARTTLMRRLSGHSSFTIAELAAIAAALDVEIDSLVGTKAGAA